MKNHVIVVPVDSLIIVEGLGLHFDFISPSRLHALQWHDGAGELEWTDATPNTTLRGEADYAAQVAPFVSLWEAEHARLTAEAEAAQAAEEAEYNSLEATRARKLAELATAFSAAQDNAHLTSAAGFEIDANEAANRNISGLITLMSSASAPASMQFCDYNNAFHAVSLSDLQTIQLEIIANGAALYEQKWSVRDAINAAADVDALNSVVISFGG